jgi:hypothetical protein
MKKLDLDLRGFVPGPDHLLILYRKHFESLHLVSQHLLSFAARQFTSSQRYLAPW